MHCFYIRLITEQFFERKIPLEFGTGNPVLMALQILMNTTSAHDKNCVSKVSHLSGRFFRCIPVRCSEIFYPIWPSSFQAERLSEVM